MRNTTVRLKKPKSSTTIRLHDSQAILRYEQFIHTRTGTKIHIPQSSFVVTINALCFAATHDILGEIVHRALQ
ncbi:MAG: hypothetical protein HS132_16835 [Planctomycetia bacterium]|nr:hypothetical protein [Planctomycetia bacterium]